MTEIWILDTSAIIQIKHIVRASEQWAVFEKLKLLVIEGTVSFPKLVTRELKNSRHHDTPEVWGLEVSRLLVFKAGPTDEMMRHVMAEAGEVIGDDREEETADPYVLAHALELKEAGHEVIVVTEDRVDRLPLKLSMVTACERLNLGSSDIVAFLQAVGILDDRERVLR